MSKILSVMWSEYLKAVRSKAFIIGVLVMPVLFGGGLIAMILAEQASDTEERHFAVVDRTGRLWESLESSARERNELYVFDHEDPDKQVEPRWIPELYDALSTSDESAELALSSRVEAKELFGFTVLGADLFDAGTDGDHEFTWHTETPTYRDLPNWIEQRVNEAVKAERFQSAGLDGAEVRRLSRWENARIVGLTERDAKTGDVKEAEESEPIAVFVVPLILVMLLFMLVMMSVPALMNNVLEEKMQKIAEVLVSAVSPFELLMGKLASAVLVSFTLAVIYLGAAIPFLHNVDEIPPQVLDALGPSIMGWFALFMLLALVIYGSMFSALGAACSELQDAQTLMMPAMVLIMIPMFFIGVVLDNPGGTLATILSFFPPATPLVMFMRVAIPPGVEWWELAVALLATATFTVLCVMASGKIFRIGILSQGQTPNYRKLVSWLMSK